jgi:hypothetical protein
MGTFEMNSLRKDNEIEARQESPQNVRHLNQKLNEKDSKVFKE